MRLLLLAPPGAGQGTQGERLAAWSGARHIAGELLRAQARAGSPLGREIAAYQARGDLVAVDADQPPRLRHGRDPGPAVHPRSSFWRRLLPDVIRTYQLKTSLTRACRTADHECGSLPPLRG